MSAPIPPGCDATDVLICQKKEEFPEATNAELGEMVGLNEKTIRRRTHRAEWLQLFHSRHLPVRTAIELLKPMAVRTLAAAMKADKGKGDEKEPDNQTRRLAAVDVLGGDLDPPREARQNAQAMATGLITADAYLAAKKKAEKIIQDRGSRRAKRA